MSTDRENTCCFTGHRVIPPDKVDGLRERLQSEIERLYTGSAITIFYAGGATGFDVLASEAVIERRTVHPDMRLIVVMPHREQAKRWSADQQARYEHIKSSADEVICLAAHYYRGCMQCRNRYMVDRSSICICYLTQATGGTAYTVKYARNCGLPVINLAEDRQKCVSP